MNKIPDAPVTFKMCVRKSDCDIMAKEARKEQTRETQMQKQKRANEQK